MYTRLLFSISLKFDVIEHIAIILGTEKDHIAEILSIF